jgi:hypothetical protein
MPRALRKNNMNLRHAAGVALVGWYLIIPPLINAPSKINTEAPLKTWKVYKGFNTAEACRKSLSAAQSKYGHAAVASSGSIERGTRAFALQMVFARCASGDDPRLSK